MTVSKTKAKLVDVARQLFAKMGVENTTMNDIALASKKGRRTLYTYFKSKDEIYLAVVESELDILSDIASVEIFVNQGALSAAFYHLIEKNTPSVTISVEGGQTKLKQLTIHELNSMYVPQ